MTPEISEKDMKRVKARMRSATGYSSNVEGVNTFDVEQMAKDLRTLLAALEASQQSLLLAEIHRKSDQGAMEEIARQAEAAERELIEAREKIARLSTCSACSRPAHFPYCESHRR